MNKTKIVCTLGPACDDIEVLEEMLLNGMRVARMNFSHGTHEEHKRRLENVRKAAQRNNITVGVMLDTKGPEIRIKHFKDGNATLVKGQMFTFTNREVLGDESIVSVTYKDLYKAVKVGDRVLLDDGLIVMEVVEIKDKDIILKVLTCGVLSNNKSINIPHSKPNLPFLTESDKKDILFGIENEADFIAASFVRSSEDVLLLREFLMENGGEDIWIISKIENGEGVINIDEIIQVSDGIMVARGDLGVEIDAELIPITQKDIIEKCNIAAKPVITATQMLDSMIRNPHATRAEINDVANAVFDGTDAVMLSAESAAGKYPVESVKTLSRVIYRTEASERYFKSIKRDFSGSVTTTNVIGHAACDIAEKLNVKAIIAPTASGYTPRLISKFRPNCLLVASTSSQKVLRKLSLVWGVYAIYSTIYSEYEILVCTSVRAAAEEGLLNENDMVVVTSGMPINVTGTTNNIRVVRVHDMNNCIIK
jgi:pyruvate kinase